MTLPTKTTNPTADLRVVKFVYFSFLFSTVLYFYVLFMIAPPLSPDMDTTFPIVFGINAAMLAAIAVYYRQTKIMPVVEAAQPDTAGVGKLRLNYIIVYAFSEAIFLQGFVLRFLGSSNMVAAPFWAAAYALFAINFPRWPAETR